MKLIHQSAGQHNIYMLK